MDQTEAISREITPGAVVAPPPAWADLAAYPAPQTANPHFVANGLCVLLDDSQIDLCGPERAWFYRRAELVTASAGAERAAQFSVTFDPAFERVEIHSVAVIRGGERVEHATSAFFEVLRRERNMERLQFDGALTIHLTLPDVRPGDIVETSYTAYGMRKALGGRHSAFIGLEWAVGICEVRLRQRSPKQRMIAERTYNNVPEGTRSEDGDVVDRRWRLLERPSFRYEALAPPWALQSAALQLSEWSGWGEVVDAFAPLYEDDGPLPPDVEQEIARIAATETTTAGRAAAILRFAQSAVRYLAISMGEGGYTPRTIAEIVSTRYGDCKDKSKLYVQMARRLGVDAAPALVNTRDGYALAELLPSGQIFDHCIVRVVVDGRVYWVDPTRQSQPSPLDAVNQCHFGWALPMIPGVEALERMPDPSPAHTQETLERVTLGQSPEQAVRYEWRITSRRGRAEWVREAMAREGQVGMFKLYAEDIGRRFASAKPVRQELIEDNARENALTVLEVYEITEAWAKGEGKIRHFSTHDLTMRSQLQPLDAGQRKLPIYLGQVGKVSRRVELETTYDIDFKGWSRNVESSAVNFKSEFSKDGPKRFVLEQSLEFNALTLPAAEADKYREIVAELDQSDVVLSAQVNKKGVFVGAREAEKEERGGGWLFWVIWFALVLAFWTWRYFAEGS